MYYYVNLFRTFLAKIITLCTIVINLHKPLTYVGVPHSYEETLVEVLNKRDIRTAVCTLKQRIEIDPVWQYALASDIMAGIIATRIGNHYCYPHSPEEANLVALMLGTKGALTWYKKRVTKDSQNKNSHQELLNKFLIAECGQRAPDLVLIKRVLDFGASVNSHDKGNIWHDNPGRAALTDAAAEGHTAVVQLLLDHGADIETKSPWNSFTALMKAAQYGHTETLEFLISRKANINSAVGYRNTTALHLASAEAHVENVKKLVSAGANIHAKDEDGRTPLMRAQDENERSETKKADYATIIILLQNRSNTV